MQSRLRRASGFAAVGTLALAAPALGRAAAVPFAAVAVLAAFVVEEGPLFELFARPGDYEDRRLNGLAGFSLAAAGLALLATVPRSPLPMSVFVAAVFVVAYGNLGAQFVRESTTDDVLVATGFVVAGFLAATLGQLAVALYRVRTGGGGGVAGTAPDAALLALAGGLTAALLREMLYQRDDPLVMLTAGFSLWLLAALSPSVSAFTFGLALAVTVGLGVVAHGLGTASVTGLLTGVLLAVVLIVLGGLGWFAALITFFGVGALSTKFRYDEKADRGVAQENDGARGSGNVLGNAAVAMLAVVGYAATQRFGLPVAPEIFRFAFAGSLAAAMSDTLSSELGGLFDSPRLITSLEPVDPGTDGAVTWQGELAGVTGAAVLAAVVVALFPVGVVGGAAVVVAGFVGMTVDSFLGATVEGDRVSNEAVNFLATLSGAVAAVALAVPLA
ncbi:MAG: TIGR00297 family protein [Halolamina sp.]